MAAVAQHFTDPFEFRSSHRSANMSYSFPDHRIPQEEEDVHQPRHEFGFPTRSQTPTQPPINPFHSSTPLANNAARTHTRAINSMSALPAFSFNPSAPSTPAMDIPSRSSQPTVSAPTTPARTGRHRRTASELIGGSATGARPLGGSPSKIWLEGCSVPSARSFGSLPSKLDARHSHSDTGNLQELPSQGSSAIGDSTLGSVIVPDGDALTAQYTLAESTARFQISTRAHSRSIGVPSDEAQTLKVPNRHRVGFSEAVEFIPRPLSTISSDSGSSMSTIRAHSISGSISSVIASGSNSPLSKATHSPLRKSFDAASLPLPARHGQSDVLTSIEPLGPSITHDVSVSRPTLSSPSPQQNHELILVPLLKPHLPAEPTMEHSNPIDVRRPRKVGSWATLLGRKPRSPSNSHDSPVPHDVALALDNAAADVRSVDSPAVELSEDFDANPTSIIVTDSPSFEGPPTVTPPLTPSDRISPEEALNDNASSAVIDLDALMASEPYHDPRFPKPRGPSGTRRSMHSNATSSGFFAVAAHRRADSAPSFTSNSFDPAGFRDRNSSISSFKRSKMEDVFEEDEDAPEKSTRTGPTTKSNRGSVGLGLVTANDPPFAKELSTQPSKNNDVEVHYAHSHSGPRRLRFVPSPVNPPYPHDDAFLSIRNDHIDTYEHRRPSSDTGYLSINDYQSLKHARSIDVETFPLRNRAYGDTRTGSPVSTPCGCGNDCSSEMGRDVPASLGHDGRRAYPHSMGDRGSDVRFSVDDVPSLVSSRSTVTSAVQACPPSTSSRGFAARSAGSSMSLSSALDRHRKRSSIVSFSRFVGNSFNERTREPLEPGTRWQRPLEAKDVKSRKPSRLSRLLRFLKPKQPST